MTAEEQKALVDAVVSKLKETPTPVQQGGLDFTKLFASLVTAALAGLAAYGANKSPTPAPVNPAVPAVVSTVETDLVLLKRDVADLKKSIETIQASLPVKK